MSTPTEIRFLDDAALRDVLVGARGGAGPHVELAASGESHVTSARQFMLVLGLCVLAHATLLAGCYPTDAAVERHAGLTDEVLAGLELRDQDDKPLALSVLRGKTVILSFMFTSCPTVCPMQTRDLAEVQQAIPETVRARVHMLSISVDPTHDPPAALKRFAEANGADLHGWSFVTASRADIGRLAARIGVFDPRAGDAVPAAHGTTIYVFDAQGRMVQRYAGLPVDRPRLVREIQQIDARRAHPEGAAARQPYP